MILRREWAMPNSRTFQIKPIKELLEKYCKGIVLDLFPFPFKEDCFDVLEKTKDKSADVILLDPPYSFHQAVTTYKDKKHIKITHVFKEVMRVLNDNGIVIHFGWNSNGIGEKNGFKKLEILLVAHGGNHNDTICVVEEKQKAKK
jgi:hypothetical protein